MSRPMIDITRFITHQSKIERAAQDGRVAYCEGLSRRELQALDSYLDSRIEIDEQEAAINRRFHNAVLLAMGRRKIPQKRTPE